MIAERDIYYLLGRYRALDIYYEVTPLGSVGRFMLLRATLKLFPLTNKTSISNQTSHHRPE